VKGPGAFSGVFTSPRPAAFAAAFAAAFHSPAHARCEDAVRVLIGPGQSEMRLQRAQETFQVPIVTLEVLDARFLFLFGIVGWKRARFFILLRCCNHFSFFILTELGVGIIVANVLAFLWRGAWGGFGATNVRPLIFALVVSIRNHRDGRVATFRPIPQSVSGVGVRFSIGDKTRNLGEKSFCLTRRERKFCILLRCCNNFSFFILTELGVELIVGNVVAFLLRGAWGRFGVLAWLPPIALSGWGLVELASSGGVSMPVWLGRAGVLRIGMLISTEIHQLLTYSMQRNPNPAEPQHHAATTPRSHHHQEKKIAWPRSPGVVCVGRAWAA
jgi:hypothetical protein